MEEDIINNIINEKEPKPKKKFDPAMTMFIVLSMISISSIIGAFWVAQSVNGFVDECNEHWTTQIDAVCRPGDAFGYDWQTFNGTAGFPVNTINEAVNGKTK